MYPPVCLQTATDYGTYLANEASPLYTSTIVDKCTQKLVDDWNNMRCQVCCCSSSGDQAQQQQIIVSALACGNTSGSSSARAAAAVPSTSDWQMLNWRVLGVG
jgi:hypothetical protein